MNSDFLSLSGLLSAVQGTLQERFAAPVWVCAEVADLRGNASGHCYLELVEKDGRGVAAQCRAAIWRTTYARLSPEFLAVTGQRLAPGMKILALCSVTYHPVFGFSLVISAIDPAYTLGEAERARQLTIARLQKEGVWEMNRTLPIPPLVQRVAVVSSATAAGYQDFCNELSRSLFRFEIELFEAVMQGAGAEDSVITALERVAERADAFDAVAVIRGGGGVTDLSCFDAYRIAAHVAQFPLPVLTGIGHDKDVSVSDLVARCPLKTPTAVAAWLVERMASLEGWLQGAALQLRDAVSTLLRGQEVRLERYSADLTRFSAVLITRHSALLQHFSSELSTAIPALFRREKLRLEAASALIESRKPAALLALGFAVVRGTDGRALRTIPSSGTRLQVEVLDGKFNTVVE